MSKLTESSESPIKGISEYIQKLREQVKICASKDEIILILGDTGTGKEVIAKTLHALSKRNIIPWVAVNCRAIPDNLIDDKLFGHEKGAFTDAKEQRKGVFDHADKGTLFLDEIGTMTLDMQEKLLRVIEEKKICRVGGTIEIEVDVRIIAATNENLEEKIKSGEFREDLHYRLDQLEISTKPLIECPEDIVYFVYHFSQEYNIPLEPRIKFLLYCFDFPGNVRQLISLIKLNDYNQIRDRFVKRRNAIRLDIEDENLPANKRKALRERLGIMNRAIKVLGYGCYKDDDGHRIRIKFLHPDPDMIISAERRILKYAPDYILQAIMKKYDYDSKESTLKCLNEEYIKNRCKYVNKLIPWLVTAYEIIVLKQVADFSLEDISKFLQIRSFSYKDFEDDYHFSLKDDDLLNSIESPIDLFRIVNNKSDDNDGP